MPILNHPDYDQELQWLNYTLGYLNDYHVHLLNEKQRLDKEVEYSKRHFNSDNSQQYIDLMLNTTFQTSMAEKLAHIEKAFSKPYFARVDFTEAMNKNPEKIYIGKMSLMNEEQQNLLIVDWRAPIANLYYEGRLGDANYTCPEGSINGEIHLKRQYSIDEGILNDFFDIDITTNDEFLQAYLGANADNRLKDIVSTIQVEQNQIIRADMWKPLIVQGAAGSGKTTIALHRIAYLIYTYEKIFKPENFMIIAPNRLFLNYISEVLPELGVERVKQTTFEYFAMELLDMKAKLTDPHSKLSSLVNSNASQEEAKYNELMKKASEFKSSMIFKALIDDYMKTIENEFIPVEDFKIGSFVLFKYDEINRLFLEEYRDLPMLKRIDEIKKHLTGRLKLKKDSIIDSIQYECDRKVNELKILMDDSPKRRKLITDIIDGKDALIQSVQKDSKKAVREYIRKISPGKPFEYYFNLLNNKELFNNYSKKYAENELSEFMRKYSIDILNSGLLEIEDLAPLVHIKYIIYGMNEKIPVKHVVIDEAQDFSVFQLYVLRKIIRDSSFTILGDLCQGINSYRGIKDWDDVSKYVFDDKQVSLLNIEQSYRTTVEIMEAANSVIKFLRDPKLTLGKPVIRHGERVSVVQRNSLAEIALEIKALLDNTELMGLKSAAVICKTMEECIRIKALLKGCRKNPQIITGNEKEYKGGIVIVPSYLAKGLEFDLVIIANAGKNAFTQDELDIKLLYVAMTRPLHRLYIYSLGEPTESLRNIDRDCGQ